MKYRTRRDHLFALPDGGHEVCPAGVELQAVETLRPWEFKPFARKSHFDPHERWIEAEWNGKTRYFRIGDGVEAVGRARGRTLRLPARSATGTQQAGEAPAEEDARARSRRKGGRGGRRSISRP